MDGVEDNLSAMMNCTNPHEREPMMEHANPTLKGIVQTQCSLSPHKNLPKVLIKKLALQTCEKLNVFQQRMELVKSLVHNKSLINEHWIVNAIANVNLAVLCKAMMPKHHTTQQRKEQLTAFIWVQQKTMPREAINC